MLLLPGLFWRQWMNLGRTVFSQLVNFLPSYQFQICVAHFPATFFNISISSAFRPSVRSSCRMRWSFSVSAAAALLPQARPWLLFRFILPAIEQIRSDPVTPTRLRNIPALPGTDLRVVSCPCCLLFGGPASYRIRQSSFSGEHYRIDRQQHADWSLNHGFPSFCFFYFSTF
jgi:hypothetical protein